MNSLMRMESIWIFEVYVVTRSSVESTIPDRLRFCHDASHDVFFRKPQHQNIGDVPNVLSSYTQLFHRESSGNKNHKFGTLPMLG
jgi:hypothetical protein